MKKIELTGGTSVEWRFSGLMGGGRTGPYRGRILPKQAHGKFKDQENWLNAWLHAATYLDAPTGARDMKGGEAAAGRHDTFCYVLLDGFLKESQNRNLSCSTTKHQGNHSHFSRLAWVRTRYSRIGGFCSRGFS